MPFRTNKPPRNGSSRTHDTSQDEAGNATAKSSLQAPLRGLSHQQLVSRQRQLWHGQLSEPSQDTHAADDPKVKNRLSKPLSAAALRPNESTLSATNSSVSSMVQHIETKQKLDLEATIGLLQELKKNASPDDLVALHRALLPVKEDTPSSPQQAWVEDNAYTSAPPVRKRSVMPPGLATRSGISEDVLRKPEESASHARSIVAQRRVKYGHYFDASSANPRNTSPTRSGTPSEQPFYHTGAFRPGTLRITNGRASPDPSVISRLTIDANESGTDLKPSIAARAFQRSAETTGGHSRSVDCITSPGLRPNPVQAPQVSRPALARPISLDIPAEDRQRQLRREVPLSQRHSFDQILHSQTSTHPPSSQQNLQHRATHLSQEYRLDCDITTTPYKENDSLLDFAKRLSEVCDHEEDDVVAQQSADSVEEHARTLSMLTGEPEIDENKSELVHKGPGVEPAFDPFYEPHSEMVREIDSGSSSDHLRMPVQWKLPAGMHERTVESSSAAHGLRNIDDQRRAGHCNPASAVNDVSYHGPTDRNVVPSPHMVSDPTPPSSTAKKSPLSLFKSKSRATKRSSLTIEASEQDTMNQIRSTTDGETVCTSADSAGGQDEKQTRRLQKPMPDSVRRKRGKTLESLGTAMEDSTTYQLSEDSTRQAPESASEAKRSVISDLKTEVLLAPRADSIDEANGVAAMNNTPEESKPRFSRFRGKSFSSKRSKTISDISTEPSRAVDESPLLRNGINIAQVAPVPVPPPHRYLDSGELSRGDDFNERNLGLAKSGHRSTASAVLAVGPQDFNRSVTAQEMNNRFYSSTSGPWSQVTKTKSAQYLTMQPDSSSSSLGGGSPYGEDKQGSFREISAKHPGASNAIMVAAAVDSHQANEIGFPQWQGKTSSKDSMSSQPSWMRLPSQAAVKHLQTCNVLPTEAPELPAFPADIQSRVDRADQMVAKKLKTSPRSSPTACAGINIDSENDADLETVHAPPQRQDLPWNEPVDAHEVPQTDFLAWQIHDAQHPGWPGWERQSALWRQRKETLSETWKESCRTEDVTFANTDSRSPITPVKAPGIVFSRYITPLAAENANDVRNTAQDSDNRALKLAQSYTNLIGKDEENSVSQAKSIVSTTTTSITTRSCDGGPARIEVSRAGSALSRTSTVTTTTSSVSQYSWAGSRSSQSSSGSVDNGRPRHIGAMSNCFAPCTQADDAQGERSRALSPARHSWQIGVRGNEHLALPQRPDLQRGSSESLFDRYSGGMNFGWDREAGFGGSAGTRTPNTFDPDNRKSVQMSEQLGLDLSDIPVFLRKGPSFNMR